VRASPIDAKKSILVVEDEPTIRRLVCRALEGEQYRVWDAETLKRGLVEATSRHPDLIILDLGLPDGDGSQFIGEVRAWSQVPIIVLSARVTERDKIAALDAGADDYVAKPFGVDELLARVRASLRRSLPASDDESVVRFGDVVVDLGTRVVTKSGERVHLTPIEYRLLIALLAHPGKVLTHRHLLKEVWGPNFVEHAHYLRIYMAHLRHKLEDQPANPRHLLTESGVGYRFLGSQL
jgi:two-component system KDP operon response regulator KdpE